MALLTVQSLLSVELGSIASVNTAELEVGVCCISRGLVSVLLFVGTENVANHSLPDTEFLPFRHMKHSSLTSGF